MFEDDTAFEDEVRRIARALWPSGQYGGATILDDKERDGIFVTEEFVHIVECTTSRRKDKAQKDAEKIALAIPKLKGKYPDRYAKGWFVTLHEPTAEQRDMVAAIAKNSKTIIIALSLDQFRSKLINASDYLSKRRNYSFGSVRDASTGNKEENTKYVPLDIISQHDGKLWNIDNIAASISRGEKLILLGDYGAGKSMTLREVFFALSKQFLSNQLASFPVLLNLRDHHSQLSPAEALERHARNMGYETASQLVSAWQAGYVLLLLDGFDEIATAGWTGKIKKLKDLRYRSMALIQNFVRQSPASCGIIVAGRAHFFDSDKEMLPALEMVEKSVTLRVSEFNDEQVKKYLASKGWRKNVPEWFPSRPLLLGYMAARGLLKETLEVDADAGPAKGWDDLLTRICSREAEMGIGLDGETVRQIIQRLSTRARTKSDSGLGPLAPADLTEVFIDVCGYPPDDKGYVLLQRLPGLGTGQEDDRSTDPIDGSRKFIDRSFAEAARAGDVFNYITDPYTLTIEKPSTWRCGLGSIGLEVAAYKCLKESFNASKLFNSIRQASKQPGYDVLVMDLLLVSQRLGFDISVKEKFIIRDLLIQEIVLDQDTSFLGVEFHDCLVAYLRLDGDIDELKLPKFIRCYFGSIEGRTGVADLPPNIFHECAFDEFSDNVKTTAAILDLTLPLGTKVMLSILRKIYVQRGHGRKESALYRGLDHREKRVVPDVLELLQKEGMLFESKINSQTIWLPTRAQSTRARRILSAPSGVADPLLQTSASIG